jgi:hypothetical protein
LRSRRRTDSAAVSTEDGVSPAPMENVLFDPARVPRSHGSVSELLHGPARGPTFARLRERAAARTWDRPLLASADYFTGPRRCSPARTEASSPRNANHSTTCGASLVHPPESSVGPVLHSPAGMDHQACLVAGGEPCRWPETFRCGPPAARFISNLVVPKPGTHAGQRSIHRVQIIGSTEKYGFAELNEEFPVVHSAWPAYMVC